MSEKINQSIALSVEQLSVNYEKTPILWDINLKIPQGHLVGIVGPNGAGKSTLLKAALGLVKPLSGNISFFGKALNEARTQIAYVPQRQEVDWEFPITVRELVVMGCYGRLGLFKRPRKREYEAAERYLDMVGMSDFGDRQISQLSGGQQQRVFLARALMQEADIYFMDEPFSGVDLASISVIMNILRELRLNGKTIFVIHHDLNTVEEYFDWLILLNMRLIAYGSVKETFRPKNLMAAYGKSYALLDQAFRLSQEKSSGLVK